MFARRTGRCSRLLCLPAHLLPVGRIAGFFDRLADLVNHRLQAISHISQVLAVFLVLPGGAESLGQALAQGLELPADFAPGLFGRLFVGHGTSPFETRRIERAKCTKRYVGAFFVLFSLFSCSFRASCSCFASF